MGTRCSRAARRRRQRAPDLRGIGWAAVLGGQVGYAARGTLSHCGEHAVEMPWCVAGPGGAVPCIFS